MLRTIRKSPPVSPSPAPTPLRRPAVHVPEKKGHSHSGKQPTGYINPADVEAWRAHLPFHSTGRPKQELDSAEQVLTFEESRDMQVDGKEFPEMAPVVHRSEETLRAVTQQTLGAPRLSRKKKNLEAHDALKAKKAIETLTSRVARLERRERLLLSKLAAKKETIKDLKVVVEGAENSLIMAEETISNQEAALEESKIQWDRYQRWWLTENRSLKVVLESMALDEIDGLQHIVSSSQARYAVYAANTL